MRGRQEKKLMHVKKQHRLPSLTSFSVSFPYMLWMLLIGGGNFICMSFADDISKTTFPISTRKIYLELKSLNI